MAASETQTIRAWQRDLFAFDFSSSTRAVQGSDPEVCMRVLIAGTTMLLALAACQKPAPRPGADVETGAAGTGVDTTVTQTTTRDTALISHDTSVKTDTTKKHGGVVDKDTVKKP